MAVGTAAAIMGGLGLASSIFGGRKASSAANQAGQILSTTANDEAAKVAAESERGATGVLGTGNAAADQSLATGSSNQQALIRSGEEGRDRILEALKGLEGYEGAGRGALERIVAGLQPGGEFSTKFDFNGTDFLNDKGVQFRIQQGRRALENSAAAKGLIGGNVVRATEEFAQGVASDEFGRAFDRASGTFQMNRNNTLNPLMALSAAGQNAVGQRVAGNTAASQIDLQGNTAGANAIAGAVRDAGSFRTGAESEAARLRQNGMLAAAGLRTDAASAQAGAKVGSANAWLSALQNGLGFGSDILSGIRRSNRASIPRAGDNISIGGGVSGG
jgi:hypothetical protein